jgi:hypothetical protein
MSVASRKPLIEIEILFNLVDEADTQFFAAAVHRELRTPDVANHRQMAASALVSLEGATLLRQPSPQLARRHRYNMNVVSRSSGASR